MANFIREKLPIFNEFAKKQAANAKWNNFGLMRDDMINEEHDVVQAALKRVPKNVLCGRYQRYKVALHYSMLRRELPVSEQMTPEKDERYLTPFIQQVLDECHEAEKYDKGLFVRQ